ncbi:MAG TPA: protease complex subunit PrcB family protein [Flavobacterium sp.]
MKRVVVLLLLATVLFSCSSSKQTVSRPLFEVLTQQEDGGGNIQFFEILSESNEIAMLQNDDKLKDKINSSDVQTSNFIVLNMGEKPTGGYQIGLESVVETDKNIIITIKEIAPEPNAMVTQAITYPYSIVRINSKKEIIIK